jgi:pyruvate/2-oxoglutarate dehydrogenase complex dihydrolipoamide dehydrogenase (E3) component
MAEFDTDLFIIGAGSGGVRAARIAAEHGARVMVAEEYRVGGTCVIRGCVPKKLLVYASRFAYEFEEAEAFGWTIKSAKFDWPTLIANKDKEIARLEAAYRSTLGRNKVEIVESRAVVDDPHTVRILKTGARIRAEKILIATGGHPEMPKIPGARACHQLQRSIPPQEISPPHHDRRRRIYRLWSLPAYSPVSAHTSRSSIAATKSCAASTTMCAIMCASKWNSAASIWC